jgi:D-ribose pyranose/furanose isomerase RbsD
MDTAASNADQVRSQTTREENATQLLNAQVQDKSLVLLQTATDVTLAHQTSFQMPTEEHVLDQSQFAHVPRNTQLMDMSAKNVQIDKLLIQTTTRDAYQDNATTETRSSQPETTATDVILAHKDMSQTLKELSARESSQLAVALKSMTLPVMSVFHAQITKLLPTETKDVSQDNAQDSTKSLEPVTNASLVENARRDQLQITSEEDALDTSPHHAHATKDSMNQDSDVKIAQLELDHLLITEAASASTVTRIKSSEETCSAHNVNGAHQVQSQIQRERTVSSSQDHQSLSMESQLVMNSQYSTWIDLNVSSVQTT